MAFGGGEPKLLSDGDGLRFLESDRVVFVKERGVWVAQLDGSSPAKRFFFARGEADLPMVTRRIKLAFVSARGDRIGIYTNDSTPLLYLTPSTSRDTGPRWSPDGTRIVFVRRPGNGGTPEPILEQRPQAWALWIADAGSGEGKQLWKAPFTLRGSPTALKVEQTCTGLPLVALFSLVTSMVGAPLFGE